MNTDDFMWEIFNGCRGVPITANAEEGFQSRRWAPGKQLAGKVYFGISTTRDIPRARVLQRRTEDLVETRVIVLDDWGTKVKKQLPVGPSYMLETSHGNFQPGFILRGGVEPARAAALIEALAAAGWTDPGSKRADRIMRIPGSLNDKYAEPFYARLTEWHPDRTWTLSELAVVFGVVPSDTPALPDTSATNLEPGETDPVLEWIVGRGLMISGPNPRGWYAVKCPWAHEHTGDVDHGTDYRPGKPGVFRCLHGHCQDRKTAALRDWISKQDPGADLRLVGKQQLADLQDRLGGALGLNLTKTAAGTTPAGENTVAEGDRDRLWAVRQAQATAETMFARKPVDEASLSPAQALAAILREVYLDPCLLPDYDTTAGGNAAKAQAATDARVHEVMNLIGMKARWNVLSAKAESSFDRAPGYVAAKDNNGTAEETLVHACVRCGIKNAEAIRQALKNRALASPYSPVCEWILSERWDGKSRLEELYRTIGMRSKAPEAERWKKVAIRRWAIQTVTAIRNWDPGRAPVDVGYMLILQGKQGLGKSKWIERLLPAPWVSIGKSLKLDHGNERDVVSRVTRTPITEIGELDGSFRRSDDAALKNFLTATIDVYRPPYGRYDIERPRGTVFAASVNPTGFLKDATGERRYWPLAVETVDFAGVERIDRQQLWAEVWALQEGGEPYWLQEEEQVLHQKFAVEHHAASDVSYIMEELEMRRVAFPDKRTWVHTNAKDLAKHYMVRGSMPVYVDLNSALERANYRGVKVRGKAGWWVPPYAQTLTPAQQTAFQVVLGGKGGGQSSEPKS